MFEPPGNRPTVGRLLVGDVNHGMARRESNRQDGVRIDLLESDELPGSPDGVFAANGEPMEHRDRRRRFAEVHARGAARDLGETRLEFGAGNDRSDELRVVAGRAAAAAAPLVMALGAGAAVEERAEAVARFGAGERGLPGVREEVPAEFDLLGRWRSSGDAVTERDQADHDGAEDSEIRNGGISHR